MPERTRTVGLGAGGHAKVVLEILADMNGFDVVGLLDPRTDLRGSEVHGVPVLGGDDLLGRLYDDGVKHAFVGLGSADDTRPRRRLFDLAVSNGYEIVTAVHATALVSPSATAGRGATIMARAVVNAAAVLGEDVIVNTGAIVEHDCRLGSHVHIASGATLASGVIVGDGAHVGAGATVLQGVHIGAGSVVGAGAVVVI